MGQKIRSERWLSRALALFVVFALSASVAVAQPLNEATKTEARERFHRGLKLFESGDDAGALAEFQRAHELTRHPLLLYNIGLVYAAMKRPVEAVDTLDRLLAAPGELDAKKLDNARRARAEQAASVGQLAVATKPEGATIEVDGVARGRTPLERPIRVARGAHIVAVLAPGYLPVRREVLVASGGTARFDAELERADARLAELEVPLSLPGVDVRVDGQRVGTTPLSAPLVLAPGARSVELSRPGYRSVKREVRLGAGTRGRIDAELVVDVTALAREGGTLSLDVSEPNATVWLDGTPVEITTRTPHGEHVLRVERDGFLPVERSILVPKAGTARVRIDLEPTPETRADYVGRTTSQRTWGMVALGGGAVIAGGSVGFLIYNAGAESDANDTYQSEADKHEPGGSCDPDLGLQTDACRKSLELSLDDLKSIRSREKFGWIGLGTGVAVAALGVFLLVSNDDPDRYEPGPESDQITKIRAFPTAASVPGGFTLGVIGTF